MDAARKGRLLRKGEHNGRAVLTDKIVRAIKLDNRHREIVAAKFGVSGSTVNDIRYGRTWTHI